MRKQWGLALVLVATATAGHGLVAPAAAWYVDAPYAYGPRRFYAPPVYQPAEPPYALYVPPPAYYAPGPEAPPLIPPPYARRPVPRAHPVKAVPRRAAPARLAQPSPFDGPGREASPMPASVSANLAARPASSTGNTPDLPAPRPDPAAPRPASPFTE